MPQDSLSSVRSLPLQTPDFASSFLSTIRTALKHGGMVKAHQPLPSPFQQVVRETFESGKFHPLAAEQGGWNLGKVFVTQAMRRVLSAGVICEPRPEQAREVIDAFSELLDLFLEWTQDEAQAHTLAAILTPRFSAQELRNFFSVREVNATLAEVGMPTLSKEEQERILKGSTKARLCYNQEDLKTQVIALVQDDFLAHVRALGLVRLEKRTLVSLGPAKAEARVGAVSHPWEKYSPEEIKNHLQSAAEGLKVHGNREYHEGLVRSCPFPVPYSYWHPLNVQFSQLETKAIEMDPRLTLLTECPVSPVDQCTEDTKAMELEYWNARKANGDKCVPFFLTKFFQINAQQKESSRGLTSIALHLRDIHYVMPQPLSYLLAFDEAYPNATQRVVAALGTIIVERKGKFSVVNDALELLRMKGGDFSVLVPVLHPPIKNKRRLTLERLEQAQSGEFILPPEWEYPVSPIIM